MRRGETNNSTSISASSEYSYNYAAAKGIFTSDRAWIPKLLNKLHPDNPDFLQVDLGNVKTITALQTRGLSSYYVKKFQILLSNDGKSFLQYKSGNKTVCVYIYTHFYIYKTFIVITHK